MMLCRCRVLGHPSGVQAPWSECVQLGGSALGSPLGCWRCRGSRHVSNLTAVPWAHPSGWPAPRSRDAEVPSKLSCRALDSPSGLPLLGAGMQAPVPSGSGSWTSAHLLEVHRWVPLLVGVAQSAAPLPLWALRAHVRHKSAAGRACRVRTRVRRGRADLSARAVLLVCCTSRRSAGASR